MNFDLSQGTSWRPFFSRSFPNTGIASYQVTLIIPSFWWEAKQWIFVSSLKNISANRVENVWSSSLLAVADVKKAIWPLNWSLMVNTQLLYCDAKISTWHNFIDLLTIPFWLFTVTSDQHFLCSNTHCGKKILILKWFLDHKETVPLPISFYTKNFVL